MKKLLRFFQLYGIYPKTVRGEEKGRVRERREQVRWVCRHEYSRKDCG